MRHLFNALKEHWQIYVGLLLGLTIGLLVGVGFADWKSLVKGLDSKVTDWISAISTVIGVYVAWRVAQSWKQQKIPDLKKKLLDDILEFANLSFIYNETPEKYLNSLSESKVKILYLISTIDNSFKALKFFDYNLSEILVKKIDDFEIEFHKLFIEMEKDEKKLIEIFGRLIELSVECENIILSKDVSS